MDVTYLAEKRLLAITSTNNNRDRLIETGSLPVASLMFLLSAQLCGCAVDQRSIMAMLDVCHGIGKSPNVIAHLLSALRVIDSG